MAAFISFQPRDFFKTLQFTGTGASNTQTYPETTDMQSDFIWFKNEDDGSGPASAGTNHMLTDANQGVQKYMESNETTVSTSNANSLTAFNSDGFTVGSFANCNQSGSPIISYNWKGGSSTSGTTTGSGTGKAYTAKYNTTSGFSCITYKGNATSGHTIPHHLGVAPHFLMIHNSSNAGNNWECYSQSLGTSYYLRLNTNDGKVTNTSFPSEPTSTVFSLANRGEINGNDEDYICYAFAPKSGFSDFGRYVGNGNDNGTFVYTGFRPSLLIIKKDSAAGSWCMWNDKFNPANPADSNIFADENYNKNTVTADYSVDFLSNGFKLRNDNTDRNANDQEYQYLAWAQFPFVASNDTPGTAR